MLAFYISVIEDHNNDDQFEELYYKYQSYVMNIALSILHHQQDAEDASQKTWIAVARNFYKIEDIHSDKTKRYITIAIKNHSYNILKKKQNNPILESIDFNHISDFSSHEDAITTHEKNSHYQCVLQFILNMDEKYRDVLSLYYLDHYKPSEIASMLNRPLATVKSQLKRGKKHIIQFYKENIYHDK